MDIPPVSSGSAATRSQSQLATNFDTFLTLLTAQLKNQDPLEPMDSNEFTQQLVQFSQVEQQINSNKNLESLIALTKARSSTDAVSYLGRDVTVTDGSGGLADGSAHWTYNLANDAASSSILITDSKGKMVYAAKAETTAGAHDFVWNG